MTHKLYLIVFTTLCFLSLTGITYGQEGGTNKITFLQADSSFIITKSNDSILLERKPFSLRFFVKPYDAKNEKFYAAQIAILEDMADTLQLKVGQSTKDISYFEPGTGMAPGENGKYDTIYITNTGHHYVMYESEIEKRAELISKSNDELELEWKIVAAYYQEKEVQFSDLKLPYLCFIILIDHNLNGIIDNDELRIIKVFFK